jgi:hypothetical protein
MHNTYFKKIYTALNLLSLLLGSFAAVAQSQVKKGITPKTATTAQKQAPKRCAGGWSGVVTFTKTLKDSLDSDEPGIRKSIDRIKHKTSRDLEYKARAVVDSCADPRHLVVNTNEQRP